MDRSNPAVLDGARVLVVEDEYFIAHDLAAALKAAGARPIGPVSSVPDAEARIAGGGVDAAILDLNLQGSMASELATQLTSRHVPCLIVSGYGEGALPESVKGIPHLEKPVDYGRVVEELGKAIESAGTARVGISR